MGSVTNSLSSALANIVNPVSVEGTSSSGGIFTGTSQFSGDFQNEISREVAIADLPITLLQNQQTALNNQSTELTTLDSKFSALQTAVQGITDAMSGSSYSADIDNPDVVSATLGDGATQGVYNIQVNNIGAYQTSLSTATWNASGSTPNTYTLVVGSNSYQFTPTDNSAASVAAAINSQYGNLVQATAVNVGSASSPDERVSLQSATLGPMTLDLQQTPGVSLQTQTPGTLASYIVNNSGETVTSDTRAVTVSNGVTLNLLGTGSANVTVTLPSSALSSALSNFADAYNATATEIGTQRGQSGGALQGESIVNVLSQTLSSIADYINSGAAVNSLANLGLTMGINGQITFDPLGFGSTDLTNASGVNAFLGSATGGGFLQAATNAMTGLEDPNTGIIKTSETDVQNQLTNIGNQISTKQAAVTQLQTNLQDQLAQSDAMISDMEQQFTNLTSLLQAEQTSNLQYANGT